MRRQGTSEFPLHPYIDEEREKVAEETRAGDASGSGEQDSNKQLKQRMTIAAIAAETVDKLGDSDGITKLEAWCIREALRGREAELNEQGVLLAKIANQVNEMAAVDGTSPVSDLQMIPLAIRSLQSSYIAAARARNGEAGPLLKLQAAKHKKEIEAAEVQVRELKARVTELEDALRQNIACFEKVSAKITEFTFWLAGERTT